MQILETLKIENFASIDYFVAKKLSNIVTYYYFWLYFTHVTTYMIIANKIVTSN